MKLTAEQIQENWDKYINYVNTFISEPRKTKLKEFYLKYQDRLMLMPASHKKEYHNSFPGGYIEHVNRVVEAALKINSVWEELGVTKNYSEEELVFSALNHDLGKIGDETQEAYLPQTDQWRREKLGEEYMFNNKLEFMSVPDRGLYLLNTHNISYTKNEFFSIKLHDGIYDDANKPYLMGWLPEQKPRTALIHILHQADFLAARVEFEREWFPKFNNNVEIKERKFILGDKEKPKTAIKTKALGSVKSEGLNKLMDDFFK